MGVTPVDADLESGAPLTLPAIDAVVHAAALFRFSGPREPFFRTNVDGTVALLKAAEAGAAVAAPFGDSMLQLVVATGYIGSLIRNAEVGRFIDTNYPEILAQFQSIVQATSLEGT